LQRTTTNTYNAAGDLVRVDFPDGNSNQFQYDAVYHEVTVAEDALHRRTTYTYDPANGELLSVTDPLGQVSTEQWNNGMVVRSTDAAGRTTEYDYDAAHRLIAVVDPAGGHTTYAYDAAGNPISVTDPLLRTTTTQYDGMRRPLSVTDPAGRVTAYQ